MLKKILATTLLTLLSPVIFLGIATPLHAQSAEATMLARITLDPDLKPENSPGVIIQQETLKKAGAEAAFGNYLLQMLAGGLITIAAPVAIIIIAIAGLIATISHGNQELMEKAKKTLTWAVIGLIIIIFSWIVVRTTISIVLSTNQNQPNTTAPGSTTPTPGAGSSTTTGDTVSPPPSA